jgi:hypothetical protein
MKPKAVALLVAGITGDRWRALLAARAFRAGRKAVKAEQVLANRGKPTLSVPGSCGA